jgi:hypothetical protein
MRPLHCLEMKFLGSNYAASYTRKTEFFLSLSLSHICVPNYCRCRRLFLYPMPLIGTYTISRPPLDEWSARPRNLDLTKNNIHKRQFAMPPAGFEPVFPAGDWPQTHILDNAATGMGKKGILKLKNSKLVTCSCSMDSPF